MAEGTIVTPIVHPCRPESLAEDEEDWKHHAMETDESNLRKFEESPIGGPPQDGSAKILAELHPPMRALNAIFGFGHGSTHPFSGPLQYVSGGQRRQVAQVESWNTKKPFTRPGAVPYNQKALFVAIDPHWSMLLDVNGYGAN